MCRIAGGFAPDLAQKLPAMAKSMAGGGDMPSRFFYDKGFGLCHNRLAIVDTSENAAQPAYLNDKVLSFNGEIYNFKSLVKELDIKEQTSDTKVLLAALERWGVQALNRLDGMFAFAFYDKSSRELILARDRYGVKPLYYYQWGEKFIFASELKAFFAYDDFDKSISQTALAHFLQAGYTPQEQSIFSHIKKLPAGCFLKFKNGKIKLCKYYDLKSLFLAPKHEDSRLCEKELESSVASRVSAGVDFTLFLSGGIDSSLSAAILKKQGFDFKSICIGFESAKFDERSYARAVAKALNIKHYEFVLSQKQAQELLLDLPKIYDEPFADSSAIATLFLCQKAKEFAKVALSSDGGDELGLGYARHALHLKRWEFYSKFKFFSPIFSALPYPFLKLAFKGFGLGELGEDKFLRIKHSFRAKDFMQLYALEFSHFKDKFAGGVLDFKDFNISQNLGDNMSYADMSSYLSEDIFTKTDRASMSVALEVREPLMGHNFVKSILSFKGREHKAFFKQILAKYLPEHLINRPKMGFGVPVQEWLFGELGWLIDEYLLSPNEFDKRYICDLVFKFRSKERVNFAKIYNILIYLMWKKQWRI